MNRFDAQRRRLAWVLGGVFAALLAASAALIVQSFDRLRFESFHAERALADEVAGRISREVATAMSAEAARPPTDYDFLVVTGERYVARSPLSSLPPQTELPGVLGYFQVDAAGHFSTPWLPADVRDPDELKLTGDELRARRSAQAQLRQLLEIEDTDSGRRAQTGANQALFDQLSNSQAAKLTAPQAKPPLGKVAELDFEDTLANRAEAAAARAPAEMPSAQAPNEAAAPDTLSREVRQVTIAPTGGDRPLTPRISAFSSSVDPPQLVLLDPDHLVLYRKVWLAGQLIQGAVLDRRAFLDASVGRTFAESSLSRSSDLVIAFDGDVIGVYPSAAREAYTVASSNLGGSLLLRKRLAPPADGLELVFSVAELPAGPGATTLAWVSVMMAVVLCGGCLVLYRLGREHIRLAEQQQNFVSAVSHELKTPLTSIRMYGEILKAGWADEEKKRSYYDFILSESERLTRLVGNVLELARITRSSGPSLTLQPVSASALLDQVVSKTASAVAAAGLTLERVDEAQGCTVDVDTDAFVQVMINLVDNAIKFAADAERRVVELGSRVDGAWVEFRVRDFGPGIARDQMKKIFTLFYRSESELTRETAGTGIGLALVRELTARMGGSVDVVNRDPGAEFRVRLRRSGKG